jgi:competence protein ComEC
MVSVISCGRKNRYGHPHEELLGRLKEAGSRIRVTAEDGAVTVRVRHGKMKVSGFLQ